MNKKVFLIVIALLYALWWGGFTFYAGFVVPQGMKILGDHFKMGLITQSVTNYLNAIGVSALFVSLLFMMFFIGRREISFVSLVGIGLC